MRNIIKIREETKSISETSLCYSCAYKEDCFYSQELRIKEENIKKYFPKDGVYNFTPVCDYYFKKE